MPVSAYADAAPVSWRFGPSSVVPANMHLAELRWAGSMARFGFRTFLAGDDIVLGVSDSRLNRRGPSRTARKAKLLPI